MFAQPKTLCAALIVLLLLAGSYFGITTWRKKNAAAPELAYTLPDYITLTDFDPSQIAKIEMVNSGFVLEKSGYAWQLVSPPAMNGIAIDQGALSGRIWSMANLRAERIIEEAADDLAPYGLDFPQAHIVITDSAGKRAELFFGNATPGRDSLYVMRENDPRVYTVYAWAALNVAFSLHEIRNRELLPGFDPYSLSRFILENDNQKIEVEAMPASDFTVSAFSSFLVVSPYRVPRGAAVEKFGAIQRALAGLVIEEFIDDAPESLIPFGLDKPGRLYVESPGISVDLYFGFGADGRLYAKLTEGQGVFTVQGLEDIVYTRAFDIIDQYILIFNIDRVRDFSVLGGERDLRAEIRNINGEPEFYLNGRKTAGMEFRSFYQSVISLLVDADYPGAQGRTADGSTITITFNLADPAGSSASVSLLPYNRDFYAVNKDGVTEFLVSRSQVNNIFNTANNMVYEE